MEKLRAKLKKQGGFTLVEMLIVVAIIAILIAISIPLISASLERAREAVDDANERSAVSLAYAYYLTSHKAGEDFSTGVEKYYDVTTSKATTTVTNTIHEGGLVDTAPTEGYGQGTAIGDVTEDRRNMVIKLTIKDPTTATGSVVTAEWVTKGT